MRVSTAYQYESYAREIALAQERYVADQRRVSTGKRFTMASEDWVGAARSLSYRTVQDTITQYRKNIRDAKTSISFSVSAFDESARLAGQAQTLAVQAANGTLEQTARAAMAGQVSQIQSRLVAIGNSRGPLGEYLFAGQMNDKAPFAVTASGLTFNGDNQVSSVETAPGETVPKNFPGQAMFVNAYNALESFKNNLQGGNTSAISGVDIQALQDSTSTFRQTQGLAGVRIQSLDATDVEHGKRIDDLTNGISDIEDVDLAAAVVQMQSSQTAYQAALTAAGRGFNMSLLDYING